MTLESGAPTERLSGPVRVLASALVAIVEIVLCLSIFGPQPLGWLWVGSQVEAAGSLTGGLAVAFIGTVSTIILTVWLGKRLELVWEMLHPRAEEEGRIGFFETAFVLSTVIAVIGFAIWFFVFAGPGPTIAPDMG